MKKFNVGDKVFMKTGTSSFIPILTVGVVVETCEGYSLVVWQGFDSSGKPFDDEGWYMFHYEIELLGRVE